MTKADKEYFPHVFWYIVFVTAFGMGISIYSLIIDPTRIDIVLTFWLSTGVAMCMGYLVGKSSKENEKTPAPGTITGEVTGTISTEPSNSDTNQSNNNTE